MTGIEQLRERLNALQTLIAAARADLEALAGEEQEPPVVDPPLPPEEPPAPEPEQPRGQRLKPIKRLADFEWPVDPARIADPVDAPDGAFVVRLASMAAGRFARFAFERPGGKLMPESALMARFLSRVDQPGGQPRMRLAFLQGGEKIKETEIDVTFAAKQKPYTASLPVAEIPDPDKEVEVEIGFVNDVPSAWRYEVGSLELWAEHDGSGVPQESQPPEPPAGVIADATPTPAELTNKIPEIDDWFRAHMGAGFVSDTSNLGGKLKIANAPDGRPALELALQTGGSKNIGFQIRRKIKDVQAKGVSVSCSLWLSADHNFTQKPGIKLIGISSGGHVGAGNSYAPADQQGYYSRATLWMPENLNKFYLGLYHYALNRTAGYDKDTKKWWGAQTNDNKVPLPIGRWFRLEHRVILNTPGKEDGEALVLLDGGVVIHMTGMLMQKGDWGWNDVALPIWNESKNAKAKPAGPLWYSNFVIKTL